jgi:phosphatidate cytidylyltransferase
MAVLPITLIWVIFTAMAMDLQVFKTRALSAIVFGIILIAGLVTTSWAFVLLFAVVVYLTAREYIHLQSIILKLAPNTQANILYAVSAVLVYLFIASRTSEPVLNIPNNNLITYLGTGLLLLAMCMGMYQKTSLLIPMALGWLYTSVGLGLLVHVYAYNSFLPLALIVLIWVNDTMQYIVGANFGKHKMAPILSPKKTWEGTIGGSLLCIIVACIWGALQKGNSIGNMALVALIAAVIGTLGDLLESKLKRTAGVKDSGQLMPGHGGALDRFDSLLIAAPVLGIIILLQQYFK